MGEDGESPKVPYTPMIILLKKRNDDVSSTLLMKKKENTKKIYYKKMNNDSSILLKMKDGIYIYIKKLRKDKEREKEDSPSIDLCSPKPYVMKPPSQQHQSIHSHMRTVSTLMYAKVNK